MAVEAVCEPGELGLEAVDGRPDWPKKAADRDQIVGELRMTMSRPLTRRRRTARSSGAKLEWLSARRILPESRRQAVEPPRTGSATLAQTLDQELDNIRSHPSAHRFRRTRTHCTWPPRHADGAPAATRKKAAGTLSSCLRRRCRTCPRVRAAGLEAVANRQLARRLRHDASTTKKPLPGSRVGRRRSTSSSGCAVDVRWSPRARIRRC